MVELSQDCHLINHFDLEHALSCKKGGFVSLWHNHVRNVTTTLLNQVCKDMREKPQLQQLTGETLH